MYSDTIRQWAMDLSRSGTLTNPDGVGEIGLKDGQAGTRPAARFAIKVDDTIVTTIRFQVFGCGFTIAACAAAAELAEGLPVSDVLLLTPQRVDECLDGLPAERDYCADIAVQALHGAVRSAMGAGQVMESYSPVEEDHGPRITAENPCYQALMNSPAAQDVTGEDRHLFACLLTIVAEEPWDTAQALGLSQKEFTQLLNTCFPAVDPELLSHCLPDAPSLPQPNDEIRAIVQSHVPDQGSAVQRSMASWLATIIPARAAHPGHLWVSMGLFKRPELTASIRRLLPTMAAANHKGMRWKRYLFKTLCDQNGALLCKSPNCGECSDYALCFAPEES
ncbi:nitrogen fixation protein NifQ [uncultured Desulfuromonas sp.]|uniref:nitrogen fixation protein NifQ n=1 Tax=uncultured Desulfuromonas sp. TaxID=181013 RepID=UPI002AAB50DC|nr:nitrogen fixation protein NifQ [uncultured Desulfuromonas sp.]